MNVLKNNSHLHLPCSLPAIVPASSCLLVRARRKCQMVGAPWFLKTVPWIINPFWPHYTHFSHEHTLQFLPTPMVWPFVSEVMFGVQIWMLTLIFMSYYFGLILPADSNWSLILSTINSSLNHSTQLWKVLARIPSLENMTYPLTLKMILQKYFCRFILY